MKARIIVLTCSLMAAACGSSSTRPAQDATSGTTTPADRQTSTTTAWQPVASTAQPAAAAANNAVEPMSMDDKKASGPSQYAAARPLTPAVEANPGAANGTKDANNTKTNTRDRNNSLTPMDQGNSAAETQITANIRKGLIGEKAVSFTGKNVKIITVGTRVTLRGPVKSDRERTVIADIAKRTAGVSDVDNQLEIVN